MKNVLITGSEGFIGSHLVEKLVTNNYNVKCLVLYNSFNSIGNLDFISKKVLNNCEIIFGDIRDQDLVRKITKGSDSILNLAALIGIPYSYQAVKSYLDVNVLGTHNILQAALLNDVEKVIHTSTSEVYGTAQYTPMDENHPIVGQSPYSASKISADALVTSFHKSFNLNTLIIRPFNTFGPRQSNRAIIPTVISQFLTEKNLYLGNLKPKRDFTYVEDTAQAFIDALNVKKEFNGRVINLGTGCSYSVLEIVNIVSKVFNKQLKIKSKKERIRPKNSEVLNLVASNKIAKNFLNWTPKYKGKKGFEKGIIKTIEFFLKNKSEKKENKIFIY